MTGTSMTPAELVLIKSGIDLIKRGLSLVRKKRRKHKYSECVSTVITELLKENPDLTLAEAQLAAAQATGVDPDMDLLRAQSMLHTARRYRAKFAKATRGRWVRIKAAKKKSRPQRRVRRSGAKHKRKA